MAVAGEASSRHCTSIVSPRVPVMSERRPSSAALTSMMEVAPGLRPEKVSRPDVIRVACATARPRASTLTRMVAGRCASSIMASRWPCITVSRLLNSCATPPDSLPMTSMRWAASSPASIRPSAVTLVNAVRKHSRPSRMMRLVCASRRSSSPRASWNLTSRPADGVGLDLGDLGLAVVGVAVVPEVVDRPATEFVDREARERFGDAVHGDDLAGVDRADDERQRARLEERLKRVVARRPAI